jgi:type III secretion system HrpB2-like protein
MNPNPIESIASIDPAMQLATKQVMEKPAAVEGPSMEVLTQRFQDMMESPQSANRAAQSEDSNALSKIVTSADDMVRHTEHRIAEFRAEAPNMSPQELVAKSIELSNEASMSNFRLQAATSIVSGANKSMQSLLKNQ